MNLKYDNSIFKIFWAFRFFSRLENETKREFFSIFWWHRFKNVVMKILNKNEEWFFFSLLFVVVKSLFLICDVFYWYRWHIGNHIWRRQNEMRRDSCCFFFLFRLVSKNFFFLNTKIRKPKEPKEGKIDDFSRFYNFLFTHIFVNNMRRRNIKLISFN